MTHGKPNVPCLKFTGLYKLGGVIFAFSSLWDELFIEAASARLASKSKLPLYALFHGTLEGSFNANGIANTDEIDRL